MKGHRLFVQGYNAQAVVAENQIVIAAEISTEPVDFSALGPLISAAQREPEQANVTTRPRVVIADAGFWNEQQMDKLAADGIAVLVSPESGRRKGHRPGWAGGRYDWMRRPLATDHGRAIYQQRKQANWLLRTRPAQWLSSRAGVGEPRVRRAAIARPGCSRDR
jgi:hypothetical protein